MTHPGITVKNFMLLLLLTGMFFPLPAQTGGTRTYRFLDLPYSSRVAALGGGVAAMPAEELSFATANPALLSPASVRRLEMHYINYFSDINFGSVAYAFHTPLPVMTAAGIQYVNYGRFEGTDPQGNVTGTFTAAEYIFHVTAAYVLLDSSLTVGMSLKPLLSVLERYRSFGLVADLGIAWHSHDELVTAGLVLRNVGFQLTPYVKGEREPVPFEIRAGMAARLRHAPFRFVVTFRDLQQPDLLYPRPDDPENPTSIYPSDKEYHGMARVAENFMRHTVLGVEVLMGRSLLLSAGYNYRRRKELQVPPRTGMTGFSLGATLRLKKFSISYGRATYHLAGASNHLSFATNLKNFFPGHDL